MAKPRSFEPIGGSGNPAQASPAVSGEIIESSPDRLVLYVPAGGWEATVFVYCALVGVALAVLWTVLTAGQFQQGLMGGVHIKLTIAIWGLSVFLVCAAITLKFERLFVLLDRDRLVVQRVLLGFKWSSVTTLVPSSRAELLDREEQLLSLRAIQLIGKDCTVRFGHSMSVVDGRWLANQINEFLKERYTSAALAEQAGQIEADDLPRDGIIKVDACLPGCLRFHFFARQDISRRDKHVQIMILLNLLYWVALCPLFTLDLLGEMSVNGRVSGWSIGALVGGFVFTILFTFIVWNNAFGIVTVSLTRTTLARREHLGWINISRRECTSTAGIRTIGVEPADRRRRPAASMLEKLLTLINPSQGPPITWGVVCTGSQTVVISGFLSEADARRAAGVMQTQLRKWQAVPARYAEGETNDETGGQFADTGTTWHRLALQAGCAAIAIGGLYLVDPLLLWIIPPASLCLLAAAGARLSARFARLEASGLAAVFGLVTCWFLVAIPTFCWTAWPIRQSGAQIRPFAFRYFPPILGTESPCRVSFKGVGLTDADLERLHPSLLKLHELEELDLSETRITHRGISYLNGHETLRRLDLSNTSCDDRAMRHVGGMTRLQRLSLNGTHVTDAGLSQLEGCTLVMWLGLHGTQVTDAGLSHLKGMQNLLVLQLGNTQVTDAGLEHPNDFHILNWLDLSNTQISDAGLVHLQGQSRLGSLIVTNTRVTDAGIDNLKKMLQNPNLRVKK